MRPLGFAVAGGWIPSASWMRDVYSALADHSAHFLIDLFFSYFVFRRTTPLATTPFQILKRLVAEADDAKPRYVCY